MTLRIDSTVVTALFYCRIWGMPSREGGGGGGETLNRKRGSGTLRIMDLFFMPHGYLGALKPLASFADT